jgi:hypothetical protein
MSQPQPPQPAKLVIALLLSDKGLLPHITTLLQRSLGELDMVSPWLDFHYTDYYTAEMGVPLYRRVLVFKKLIPQQQLAHIKCQTNEVEQALAEKGCRRVNIDPGYLLYERFVLATGKNYAHRIYIGQGIYADLTLIYQGAGYQPLPWTYPDYKAPEMRTFLLQVRQKYGADLKHVPQGDTVDRAPGAPHP